MTGGRRALAGQAAFLALIFLAASFLSSPLWAEGGNESSNMSGTEAGANSSQNFSASNSSGVGSQSGGSNQSDGNNLTDAGATNPAGGTNSSNASLLNSSSNLSNGTNSSLPNSTAGPSGQTNASASANLSSGTNASSGQPNSGLANSTNSSLQFQNGSILNSSAANSTSPPPVGQNLSQNAAANATINASSAGQAGPPPQKKGLDYLRMQNLRPQSSGDGPKSFVFTDPDYSETQYALVAGASSYNFAKNDFALSAWFSTSSQDGGILVSKSDYLEGRGWRLLMNSEGTLNFGITDGASNIEIETARAFNDGSWHLAAAVRSGQAIRLYVDGEELAYANCGQALDASSNGPLSIGADMSDYDWSQTPRAQFVGRLDEPQFASYAPGIGELRAAFTKGRK